MLSGFLVILAWASLTGAAYLDKRQSTATAASSTSKVPQYFQTTPEIYAGME